jgi:hypothetical protein
MNEPLRSRLVSGWRGRVKHKNGRFYTVLGVAYRVTDSDRIWWEVVYHSEGNPLALYCQSLKRFCSFVGSVPRFEVVDPAEAGKEADGE